MGKKAEEEKYEKPEEITNAQYERIQMLGFVAYIMVCITYYAIVISLVIRDCIDIYNKAVKTGTNTITYIIIQSLHFWGIWVFSVLAIVIINKLFDRLFNLGLHICTIVINIINFICEVVIFGYIACYWITGSVGLGVTLVAVVGIVGLIVGISAGVEYEDSGDGGD